VGLGLAICRAIVHLHGGRIWAERRPEGGSAFRFALPLEEAPVVPAETT
jgi:two-component system sensor histidine kinase KdpD